MEVSWRVTDEDGCHPVRLEFSTYEQASESARRIAASGTTVIISKVIPCARFVAKVTVDVQEDEALCAS